jgi:DMSO/TMAO reductase YedYZ molybdopterin-dependent catalytic subunit/mono/diheme cytochrome c family protein
MLTVKGTSEEGSLSLAEIKNLGRDTTTAVLQCSGNGRAFFEHSPSGSQWSVGAAGCVNWTGVRLSRIAELFGGSTPGMNYLTATGGEVLPPGVDPKSTIVERSIPIEKALNDVLLAWEMNGQPIPITHGGPLRMVVPGYFGCNQIKYVKTIAFTEAQSEAKIQKKGYRFRPLGEGGNPTQPSMWRMPVKSWVNGPGADDTPVLNGTIHFHGVAFSGERGIKGAEVSMDRGQTWTPAELYGPDMGPNAWRTFRFATDLTAGDYHIVSRATDNEGDVQPPLRDENERGYRYNGWTEAGLDVRVVATLGEHTRVATPAATGTQAKTAIPTEPATLSEAGERGKGVFVETQPPCGTCHTLVDAGATGAVGPSLDDLRPSEEMVIKATANGVGIMPSFKDTLSSEQIADLARYVFEASR